MEHGKRDTNSMKAPYLDRTLNKRLIKVGSCVTGGDGGIVKEYPIYQLNGAVSCLDCYRSIPQGALVTQKAGWASGELIPACLATVQGLDMTKLKITEKLSSCRSHTCAFLGQIDDLLVRKEFEPLSLDEDEAQDEADEDETDD